MIFHRKVLQEVVIRYENREMSFDEDVETLELAKTRKILSVNFEDNATRIEKRFARQKTSLLKPTHEECHSFSLNFNILRIAHVGRLTTRSLPEPNPWKNLVRDLPKRQRIIIGGLYKNGNALMKNRWMGHPF